MSKPRKSSAILGLSQYSDSEGSNQDSDDDLDEPEISPDKIESVSTQAHVNQTDAVLRVPATCLLSGGKLNSQSNSPSSLFGSSVSNLRASPNPQQIVQRVMEDFPLDEEDRPTSPVSFHKTLEGLKENEIMIPPEPPTRCSAYTIEQMKQLKEKKDRGMDMVSRIQDVKNFRNPSIYEKLIVHCGIDEFGTNFAAEYYNPHKWSSESYYDSLSSAQKDLMDQREKLRKEKSTKVEIVTGTAKKPSTSIPESHHHHSHRHHSSGHNGSRKRSKWDVPAADSSQKPLIVPPPVVRVTTSRSKSASGSSSSKKK